MRKNRRHAAMKLGIRLPPSLFPTTNNKKKKQHKKRQQSPPASPVSSSKPPSPLRLRQVVSRLDPEPRKQDFRCYVTHCLNRKLREMRGLQATAFRYRDSMYYGPEEELRILVRSDDDHRVVWKQPSSRISWIGVYQNDTTCVVSMMDKETLRLHPRPPLGKHQLCVNQVLYTALADMFPAGPDTSSDLGDRFKLVEQIFSEDKKVAPFAIVSVAPGFVPHQEYEFAVRFLTEALRHRSSVTSIESKQIATCAMKYLLGTANFKADKIEIQCHGFQYGEQDRMSAQEIDHYVKLMIVRSVYPFLDFPP